jgi:hypothetical protein
MKTTAREAHLVLLDSRKGRLFKASRTPLGNLHLQLQDELVESWEEKEHHRPSMLAARGQGMASFPHEEEERLRRFAREASAWLERHLGREAAGREGAERALVLCSKPILGQLRREAPEALLARLELKAEDLMSLSAPQLVAHPALAGVLA